MVGTMLTGFLNPPTEEAVKQIENPIVKFAGWEGRFTLSCFNNTQL
jgi:hypothetical protein